MIHLSKKKQGIQPPSTIRLYARPLNGGVAFLFAFALDSPRRSKGGDEAVKLYLFFALMDTLILLTYPILFIFLKLRKIARNKR
jgi:hypothetical protein